MDEQKNLPETDPVEEQPANEKKEGQFAFLLSILSVLLAFASVAILAVTRVILYFGPNNPAVIRGIFSIFIFGAALAGIVVSFLKKRKPTYEFWLNVGALIVALRFL